MATTSTRKRSRSAWGKVRKLPSGRYQASFVGPDSERHVAPMTYTAKADAQAWLATQRAAIVAGTWTHRTTSATADSQAARVQRFGSYADVWLRERSGRRGHELRPRTVEEYQRLLRGPLAFFADTPLEAITPAIVRTWRATELVNGKLTQTSRAYDLLRGILNTAVDDDLINTNPCRIRGGSSSSTKKAVVPPTDDQLAKIIDSIAPQYRGLVVLAANGGLRFGEATALVRSDLTVEQPAAPQEAPIVRVRVERAVTHTKASGFKVSDPKSEAGVRTVAIFGLDAEIVAHHLDYYTGEKIDALLFPAADGVSHIAQSTFYRHWAAARETAGRPDMPFHALRHYAGTRYAQAGATPRETMSRLGHSSMGAAMRYQHSGNRDDELAARMARAVQL